MPTQIKINLFFNSVLGMTLNCIRWGSFGSSFHQGPVWLRVVQRVSTPTKGTSWRANARSFDLDSILGEHKHRIQTSGKSNRKKNKHVIFTAEKNVATWGRIQRGER